MSRVEDELIALGEAAYRLAARILRREEEARDAVQRAYLLALTKVRAGWKPEETRSWFLMVVANAARDQLRGDASKRRMEANMQREVRPEKAQADGELTAALRRSMDALEEKFRIPVALCCEEGLSQREAAAVLGIPQQTVSVHVNEGLRRLRDALARAGYTATPAVVIGALAHTAPAVPAGLTAFVQSLVSANIGKAAVGAALKISARFSAKKAAGLALGWKVAGAVVVGAIGTGAAIAVNQGLLREKPAVPVVQAPESPGAPAPLPDGPAVLEDDFDSISDRWEVVVGNSTKGFEAVTGKPEQYWRMVKSREGWDGGFRLDRQPQGRNSKDISVIVVNPDLAGGQNRLVGLRSRQPIGAERFVVEARLAFQHDGQAYLQGLEIPANGYDTIASSKLRDQNYPTKRMVLYRWEFEPERGAAAGGALSCRSFFNGQFVESSRVTSTSRKLLFSFSEDMCIDRVSVRELPAAAAGRGGQ